MQYMLLIYEDESIYGPAKNGPGLQEIVREHMVFNKQLGSARIGGAGLKSTSAATTIRKSKGAQTVHDGPFAESREQLGGYYLIDAPDLDAAIAIAKNVPLLRDGSVEIRPLLGGA
jgi:hypothetical protein